MLKEYTSFMLHRGPYGTAAKLEGAKGKTADDMLVTGDPLVVVWVPFHAETSGTADTRFFEYSPAA